MTKVLNYATAALGLALIVGISVFPNGANLWIALAIAIALTAVAGATAGINAFRRSWAAASVATSTVALGAVLIVATQLFEGVSRGWLMAIAGGVIEFVVLAGLTTGKAKLVSIDAMREPETSYGS